MSARGAAFWSLFALCLPQALWVRRRAQRFGGAPGPRSGEAGKGLSLRLVGLGDSVIDGVGCRSLGSALVGRTAAALAARVPARVAWSVSARTGANTRFVRRRLVPAAALAGADFVLVSTGVNDVTGLAAPAVFRAELGHLLDVVRSEAPRAAIAVNGLPPMHRFPALPQPLRFTLGLRARQLDAVVAEVTAARPGVARVPLVFGPGPRALEGRFARDGYHPSEASCAELAVAVAHTLTTCREALAPRPRR